jgi:hypothetical protein
MKVIWSGVASSATRKDPQTGLPLEYRLIVYDTGEAQCSCPAFAFAGSRNPQVPAKDRLFVRCKHLEVAFASGRVSDPRYTQEPVTVDPIPVNAPATVGRPPTADPVDEDDDLFGDDDYYDAHHRVR